MFFFLWWSWPIHLNRHIPASSKRNVSKWLLRPNVKIISLWWSLRRLIVVVKIKTQRTVTNPETTDDAKNDWSPTSPSSYGHKALNHHLLQFCLFHSLILFLGGGFNDFLMFIPILGGRFPTRQANLCCWWKFQSSDQKSPVGMWFFQQRRVLEQVFGVVYIKFIAGNHEVTLIFGGIIGHQIMEK